MKTLKSFLAVVAAVGVMASVSAVAEDQKPDPKLKPYKLKVCIVSGEKFGEMGDPFVYKYKDRELKFCCKDCVKDFNKNPAKYIKKLEEEEAKLKK